jgi:hypothetical protein
VSKFTPGPWRLGRCGQILGEDGEFICSARKRTITQYQKSPTEKANAALIAAAPELYDALEFALHRLESVESPIFSVRHAIQKCKSAIAKAHGYN